MIKYSGHFLKINYYWIIRFEYGFNILVNLINECFVNNYTIYLKIHGKQLLSTYLEIIYDNTLG